MTTAVLLAIKSFGTTKFSIYNITKEIRGSINNGDYELFVYGDDVEHDTVKEHFLELLNGGILDGVNETHNPNGYREYQFGIVCPTTIPQANASPTDTLKAKTTAVVQAAMASTVIPTDVQLKIYDYLKNNSPVTTKQIQSRLKGHPYTCKDIYEFLDKINLIDPNSKNFPDSAKFTVAI